MVNTAALAPKASLAHTQPVMGVQPCRQAGVNDLSVQPTHQVKQRDAPVVPRVLLIALLEEADNFPETLLPRYLCGPQGLHEPSKHVQDGWAPVLEHLLASVPALWLRNFSA